MLMRVLRVSEYSSETAVSSGRTVTESSRHLALIADVTDSSRPLGTAVHFNQRRATEHFNPILGFKQVKEKLCSHCCLPFAVMKKAPRWWSTQSCLLL